MSEPQADPWDDEVIGTGGMLALFLGGSEDSFTGILLTLISKAQVTPENMSRLELAFPREVAAWRMWQSMSPAPTFRQLREALEGAPGEDVPRAVTAEELRDRFMDTLRIQADYWAGAAVRPQTTRERLQGLLHSVLCVFDGVTGGLPAFDIAASPHPDDKAFHQSEGENWIEPGTVINDCALHEILFHRGIWRDSGTSAPATAPGARP